MRYFKDDKLNKLALNLRKFAEEQAEIENIPFWKIIRNKANVSICSKLPITIEEFETKKVLFGREKVVKYGPQIIEIVREYLNEEESSDENNFIDEKKKDASSLSEKLKLYINILQGLNNDVNIMTGEVVAGLDEDLKMQFSAMTKFFDKKLKSIERLDKYFPRQGEKWTKEEDDLLLSEYNNGKSISEICSIHKRSDGAIRSRLNKLIEFPTSTQ